METSMKKEYYSLTKWTEEGAEIHRRDIMLVSGSDDDEALAEFKAMIDRRDVSK